MDYRSVIITSSELGNHVPEAHLVQRGYSVTDPAKRRPATWHRAR
jgi:hypothetical protein